MNTSTSTQRLAALGWHDPRAHLLDDSWLLTIFAIVFATAVPWLVSGLSIDLLPTVAGLVTLGAIHVAFAALASRHSPQDARRARTLVGLHVFGVVVIAYVWAHAGGVHNPLFLTVFALPIVGSIFLSRWQPYLVAVLAAALVALIAALETPELRWYAPALGAILGRLEDVVGHGNSAQLPFAGFYAPSEYFVVLLEVFAIMVFACAIAAEYLGTIFERLHSQVDMARAEAERSQQLWTTLIEQLPLAAFLLDAHSSEVVFASQAARARFAGTADGDANAEGSAGADLIGRNFFEAVSFSYPELVQELLSGADGVANPCMIRHGGRLLTTEVRVRHIAQHGRRFALVVVIDMTEAFCLKAALDASEQAAVVADTQGRVLAFNRPATVLFPGARLDAELSRLLPEADPQSRWWDPGLTGRRKLHVSIMQRIYQLTSSTVTLPGEDERLYVVAFVPVARTAEAEQGATPLTMRIPRP
jgi:PAS domain-containing protein